MPQTRYTLSILGASIVGDVKKFLVDNANSIKDDASVTPEQGAEMLANAISYAVAKAMASTSFQTALKAGLGPTNAGVLISTALTPSVIEPL